MTEEMFAGDVRIEGIFECPNCGSVLLEFKSHLCSQGYQVRTVRSFILVAHHFHRWLSRQGSSILQCGDSDFDRFTYGHLKKCRCRLRGSTRLKDVRGAFKQLRLVLGLRRSEDVEAVTALSPIEAEVKRFDVHLRETQGLAEATRLYRRRYVREFLTSVYEGKDLVLSKLKRDDIVNFVIERARNRKPQSAKVLVSSLRSYLRFLQLRGDCEKSTVEAVPTIQAWRLSHVPAFLIEDDVRRLLGAFDRKTATGRRGYAMVRCLLDLGLRPSEVAALQLDDIDWRKRILCLASSKSKRRDLLPLPGSVASAISSYLRKGRPKTSERAVFVRHVPPIGSAIAASVVRAVVRHAAKRIGLEGLARGTRVLRRTAAMRLLEQGGTLKEVADLLRHRCLDTTTIYTKIDMKRLAAVPLPWPEEMQWINQ